MRQKGRMMSLARLKGLLISTLMFFSVQMLSKIEGYKLEKMKKFYNDLPVLVTGGAGFIGSHITHKLVELGAKVTVIDDLSSGKIENIENVIDKVIFVKKSVVDKDACLEATKDKAVVFHLAAFISVPKSMKYPEECHKVNVNGISNLLEAARINKVERFVFSSSSSVYGPVIGKCREDLKCNPQSPYGMSKLIGELYCQQYAKSFGVKTVALRYFNVYGERQNPSGEYAAVVAKFRRLMKDNLPLPVFGDGLQTRDFTPVERVVEANLTLAMLDKTRMNGQPFNIGMGNSINIFQLIHKLKKEFPKYSNNFVLMPARPGDVRDSCADCSKYESININF